MIGIYRIFNKKNGKCYIGQSIRVEIRWKEHCYALSRGTHENQHLQRAWNSFGKDAFVFQVLEVLDSASPQQLAERENYWISYYNSTVRSKGYNMTLGSVTNPMTQEVKDKIRLANKGRKPTPAAIAAAIIASKSPERRAKLSASLKGKKASPAAVESNRRAHTGLHQSEETKRKISLAVVEQHKRNKENPQFVICPRCGAVRQVMRRCRCSWYSDLDSYKAVLYKEQHKRKQDFHWFTDGVVSIKAKSCPEGFYPGRTKK